MKKICCLFLLSLVLAVFFMGCSQSGPPAVTESSAAEETAGPNLNISVVSDLSVAGARFSKEDLNGNFNHGLSYHNVTDVTIELDGAVLALEEAFQTGILTEEEIFAFARQDAKQGFCVEEFKSRNGLTHFTYRYPNYNLRLIYDVYETPDGQQHLICDMGIYPPSGVILGEYLDFYDEETGERLDREDWGLTLEVAQVSSTGITINCTQSSGQQVGELQTSYFTLANTHTNNFVKRLNSSTEIPSFDFPLSMEDSSEILLDWADIYGELPSGEYEIWLYIQDTFDESQVHPLMRDYHDMQIYPVAFSIP